MVVLVLPFRMTDRGISDQNPVIVFLLGKLALFFSPADYDVQSGKALSILSTNLLRTVFSDKWKLAGVLLKALVN